MSQYSSSSMKLRRSPVNNSNVLHRSQSMTPSSSNTSVLNSATKMSNVYSTNWQERQTNFKVVVRVRPPIERELMAQFQNTVMVDKIERQILVSENLDEIVDENNQIIANAGAFTYHTFCFDNVYDTSSSQTEVYETTARNVVYSCLEGFNATLVAYGQTGNKTEFIYLPE